MKRLLLLTLILFSPFSWSADAVYNKGGVAINGYDVVAYHVEQQAIKGGKDYSHNWNGVDWFFSNQTNLDAFKRSPAKYAPQYGGYCAFAASKGSLAPSDPHAWTVYKGKLYLNYSKSVRTTWKKDIDQHIARADKNWPRLK